MMSLPILSSRFFKKHRPDGGFFSKWSSFYSWNEHILPIYEWQGVLFIGCSRPPSEFPRMGQKKVVFVLCEPGVLQELWLDFQAQAGSAEAEHLSFQDAKTSIISSQFTGLPVPPEEKDPVFATDFSDLADLPEPAAPVAEETPEPAFSEPQKTAIFDPKDLKDESSADPVKVEEKTKPALELSDSKSSDFGEAPEGLSLNISSDSLPPKPDPEELTLLDTEEADKSSSSEPQDSLELLDLSVGGTSPSQENSQSITLKLQEHSNPLIASAKTASSEDDVVNMIQDPAGEFEKSRSKINMSAPERRATPVRTEVLSGGEVTKWSHNVLSSAPSNKLENWLNKLFVEMHGKFKKSMVLLKSGDLAKPWKWDPLFQQNPSTRAEISLVHPSPFRIVTRTKRSYHGYVVTNEINQRFFAEWNGAQIPEHLTIAPILVNEHVIGVLLAIGDKSSDTKEALKLAENVAGDIAKQIQAHPELRAA